MAAPVLGILGQSKPAAATPANIYTVPSARRAISSTLVACETGGAATTIRVWARIAGATAAVGNAVAYDVAIDPNQHVGITEGMTFAATDVITVQSASGSVTFTLFGQEEDVPAA